ncbi:MAG: glycine cleavage system aminomethyltransferase GcvT [Anaerovoracaceae bacterium]|jgi:aminomethyltransferase
MAEEKLKRTTLYDTHIKYGGKMVPFAGWEMPVQYKAGVVKEHMAVREKCGLFDVSHMGEVFLKGPDSTKNLNWLLTNDYTDLKAGQARYSLMCNEHGGVVDDLIVYKHDDEFFMIVVNAANREKDFKWMCDHKIGNAEFTDVSDDWGQLALQGPKAKEVLKKLVPADMIPAGYYEVNWDAELDGVKCIISTTGYTGEDGVEIYMPAAEAPKFWEDIIQAGQEEGILPCGLGARDTLRLEAGMPLYGHEMTDDITPKEALMSMFVKMDKDDFIGKAAIEAGTPPKRKKVGLEVVGRGIIREEMDVYRNGKKIGVTLSGTKCPYINKAVATALIDADQRELGEEVEVDVRGRMVKAKMVKSQFYKREQ